MQFAHASLENAAPPTSDFTGMYPPSASNTQLGMTVAVLGAGDVYQKMFRPAFDHLGIQRLVFDPNPNLVLTEREIRVMSLDEVAHGIPVFILTPPRLHVEQIIRCVEEARPFYCEKPIGVNSEEIQRLEEIVPKMRFQSYFGDFHHFMGLGLTSLMGVNMPYKNTLKIVSDESGKLREALESHQPLIEKVTRVVGHYMMGVSTVGGTADGRAWLDKRHEGGGILTDLMPHFTNNMALMGMRVGTIANVELKARTMVPGEYTAIAKGDMETTEHYAKVTGILTNGAPFEFEVAKYADKNDLFLEIVGDEKKLRLDYLPPNRKNRVTFSAADGKVLGVVDTTIDPYFLTISHTLEHFQTGENVPLFFAPQAETVRIMEQMDKVGRSEILNN